MLCIIRLYQFIHKSIKTFNVFAILSPCSQSFLQLHLYSLLAVFSEKKICFMEQHRGSYTSVGNAASTIDDKGRCLKYVALQHTLNETLCMLSNFLCLHFF